MERLLRSCEQLGDRSLSGKYLNLVLWKPKCAISASVRKQDLAYPLDVLLLLRLAGRKSVRKFTQKNGGYSIRENYCYLAEDGVHVQFELLGPPAGETPPEEVTYPYIVVKTEMEGQNIIFE